MDLAGLAAHATTVGVALPSWLPYLAHAGLYVGTVAVLYYAVKVVTFPFVVTVTVCTQDEKRREACLEILRIVYRGWRWPSRLSGGRDDCRWLL